MQKKVNESEFIELYYDDETLIYMWKFLPTSKDMDVEQLKETIIFKNTELRKHHPKYVIANDLENYATFTVELQGWIAEQVITSMKLSESEKFAVIRPKEVVTEISTEQTVDEVNELAEGIEVRMFSELEQAKKWLLSPSQTLVADTQNALKQ